MSISKLHDKLKLPIAPLKLSGIGVGKFFIFISITSDERNFVLDSVKNESKKGSKKRISISSFFL